MRMSKEICCLLIVLLSPISFAYDSYRTTEVNFHKLIMREVSPDSLESYVISFKESAPRNISDSQNITSGSCATEYLFDKYNHPMGRFLREFHRLVGVSRKSENN